MLPKACTMARVQSFPLSPVGNRTILFGNISGRFRSSRQSGSWHRQCPNPFKRFFLRLILVVLNLGGGTLCIARARAGADPWPRPCPRARCDGSARGGITRSQQAVTCATLLAHSLAYCADCLFTTRDKGRLAGGRIPAAMSCRDRRFSELLQWAHSGSGWSIPLQ